MKVQTEPEYMQNQPNINTNDATPANPESRIEDRASANPAANPAPSIQHPVSGHPLTDSLTHPVAPKSDEGGSLTTPPPGPPPLQNSATPPLHFPTVEPWPEPVDGKSLLDILAAIFTRFVILPKWAAETLALWTLHTYAFHLRDVSAYLGIESPLKRCGKTTLLELLSELAHRAVAAANISPPAFFRVIEELCPTLLIDETDTFLPGNDQLKGILNSGYKKKTGFVLRAAPISPFPLTGSPTHPPTALPQVSRF